jgi:hypothetical protein
MKSWLAALALVILAVGCQQRAVVLNELQFVGALRSNWISGAVVIHNPPSIIYEVRGQMRIPGQTIDLPFISKVHFTDKLKEEVLEKGILECR